VRSSVARALAGAGLSCALLTLAACGNGKPAASATSTPSATPSVSTSPSPSAAPIKPSNNLSAIKVSGKYGEKPTVSFHAPWAIDKTRTEIQVANPHGTVVKDSQNVEVNYYGVNGRTGKVFDESFSRKQTASFKLNQVVPGFRKGLTGQHQGSRVLIAMPGSDGYDSAGGSPQAGINVGDTLIFVVDVVSIELAGPLGTPVPPKAGLPTVADKGGKPVITIPKSSPPTKLEVQPLIKGKGKKVAAGGTVTFHYTWQTWTGRQLENNYGKQPDELPTTNMLAGMAKGLTGQPVGSRVLIVIPPGPDGYPNGNDNPKIEKTDTLVMVVDILFTKATG
jgi:peptidylprolyl isomerase